MWFYFVLGWPTRGLVGRWRGGLVAYSRVWTNLYTKDLYNTNCLRPGEAFLLKCMKCLTAVAHLRSCDSESDQSRSKADGNDMGRTLRHQHSPENKTKLAAFKLYTQKLAYPLVGNLKLLSTVFDTATSVTGYVRKYPGFVGFYAAKCISQSFWLTELQRIIWDGKLLLYPST